MNVEITRESPVLLKARVSVPWTQVAPHFKNALQSVAKSVQVPGFRKGKTPAAILKKRYKEYLVSDVVEKLVPGHLDDVIKEHQINAVGQPRLEDADLKDKESLDYVAVIEVVPEIEVKEWRDFEVEKLNIKVTPEEVEQDLENRLEHGAQKEPVTDRGLEDGDTALLELTAIDVAEGEALTDEEGFEFALKEGEHPFLREMLAGMRIGDTKTEEYEAPEDDAMASWRGKKVKILVEVMDIWHMVEPELNDEFAVKNGFDDLAAWRADIQEKMLAAREEQEESRLNTVLLQKVLENYDFQVPQGMVTEEANLMVQQQIMPYAQYLQGQNQRETQTLLQQMMQASMPAASQKARADIFLEALAKDQAIEVNEEELGEELEKMLSQTEFSTVEDLRADLEENGRISLFEKFIRRQKAMKALVEAARITMVDELTKPEVPEAAPENASSEPADQDAADNPVPEEGSASEDPSQDLKTDEAPSEETTESSKE